MQIANMILDGQRRPDVFVSAGTIPIKKLINATTGVAPHNINLSDPSFSDFYKKTSYTLGNG